MYRKTCRDCGHIWDTEYWSDQRECPSCGSDRVFSVGLYVPEEEPEDEDEQEREPVQGNLFGL